MDKNYRRQVDPEEYCKYCPYNSGEISHDAVDVCEGVWCEEAELRYWEQAEEL